MRKTNKEFKISIPFYSRNELKQFESIFPQKEINDSIINTLEESKQSKILIKWNGENIMISVNIRDRYIQEGNLSIEDVDKD